MTVTPSTLTVLTDGLTYSVQVNGVDMFSDAGLTQQVTFPQSISGDATWYAKPRTKSERHRIGVIVTAPDGSSYTISSIGALPATIDAPEGQLSYGSSPRAVLDAAYAPITATSEIGNLGAAQTVDFTSTVGKQIVVTGTLNANATITLANRAAGCKVRLLLTQDGTGGRTLNISDGTTSQPVTIPTASGAVLTADVDCPDSTSLYVTLLSPGPTGVNIADIVGTTSASGAAVTIPDPTVQGNATVNYIIFTANCTLTFPTPAAGKQFALYVAQDSTGSRLVTWPTTFLKWANGTVPVLTTTASKLDGFVFQCIDGANWLGVQTMANT